MKILFDPLFTAKPSVCSTCYLIWEIIEHIAKQRDDVFFYLLYPSQFDAVPEEMAWLAARNEATGNRTLLVPFEYRYRDRMREVFCFSPALQLLMFPIESPLWDTDVVLTSRVQQISNFRGNTGRPVGFPFGTYRQVIGLDEMPMFSFRESILWATKHMDMSSLSNYLSANAVILNNFWVKPKVSELARNYLSPSTVMRLLGQIHEATPVKLQRLRLKKVTKTPPVLNVMFSGRMSGTKNFGEVADLFRKHFAYAMGGKTERLKFTVSTHSVESGAQSVGEVEGVIEIEHNSREAFYEFLTKRAHVGITMSAAEDFSLATYEPILFGVPMLVPTKPWTDFLGPDYPFRFKSTVEAYSVISAFLEDYPGQYARFAAWEKSFWKGFVESTKNRSIPELFYSLVRSNEETVKAEFPADGERGQFFKDICQKAVDAGLKEFDMKDFASKNGSVQPASWDSVPIGRQAVFHQLKIIMRHFGFVDMLRPGWVRKV